MTNDKALDPLCRILSRLCATFKSDLTTIERVDLTNIDATWEPYVDILLSELLSTPPESLSSEDRELVLSIRAPARWRQRACAAFVWRAEVDTIMLSAYLALRGHEIVAPTGFYGPIDFKNADYQVDRVFDALSNFHFAQKLLNPPMVASSSTYLQPLKWLACMIVRGARVDRLEPIIELLTATRILGRFDYAGFRARWWEETILRRKIFAMRSDPIPSPRVEGFARVMSPARALATEENLVILSNCERLKLAQAVFLRYFKLETIGSAVSSARLR